mgnify:CR=1 FL=1
MLVSKKFKHWRMHFLEMVVSFPGEARVDAYFGPRKIMTDQPPMGGSQGSAPTSFATFPASLVTRDGIHGPVFCKQRGLDTEGIMLVQHLQSDPFTGWVSNVEINIHVPTSFPDKYYNALVRSAEQCADKELMEEPPQFKVHLTVVG